MYMEYFVFIYIFIYICLITNSNDYGNIKNLSECMEWD